MSRISKIVNARANFNNICSWVDVGSGNGQVASEMKWINTPVKVSIDKYRADCCLDNSWKWFDTFEEALTYKNGYSLFTGFDVIEHFDKEAGNALISMAQKTCDNILLFTPRDFLRQDIVTHPELVGNNPYQEHVSGWSVEDFVSKSFKVDILSKFHNPQGVPGRWDALVATWSRTA